MHYSSGNYEAFVRPRKPEGADKKTAWFVGSGLAGLAGAAFLIRDGGVSGDRITILEELEIPGGALDGLDVPEKGFVIRGGREMEEHFECLWDLYRSIPSLEIEDASVLDEFYRLNKDDPNFSLQRTTQCSDSSLALHDAPPPCRLRGVRHVVCADRRARVVPSQLAGYGAQKHTETRAPPNLGHGATEHQATI